MQVRSRYLPVSIFVLSLLISIVLLAPRSEATDTVQDPPAPPAGAVLVRTAPAVPINSLKSSLTIV